MQIERRFKEPDEVWEDVTAEDALEYLKASWKESEIIPMLEDGHTLFNPFAEYRKK